MRHPVLTGMCVFAAATPTLATGVGNVTISGTTLSAEITAGAYEADLSLAFQEAIGLSAESLGLSAQAVSAASLLSRLPDPLATSVAAGFPVVLEIDPPATGPLSFAGAYELELHTHDLAFVAGSPLRLYRAEDGGAFVDVTAGIGAGSYRVRGHGGGFSEFVIVADTRSPAAIITAKYDRLEDLLDAASGVDTTLLAGLGDLVADSRASWDSVAVVDAVDALDDFIAAVGAASSSELPNTWRSSRDLENVAGELHAAAATLRFSLALSP